MKAHEHKHGVTGVLGRDHKLSTLEVLIIGLVATSFLSLILFFLGLMK